MLLNKKMFSELKLQHEAGTNYKVLADDLAAKGYTTITGKLMTQGTLSQFMCQNGYRVFKKKRTYKTEIAQSRHDGGDVLEDIRGICALETFSDKAKFNIIKEMVGGS